MSDGAFDIALVTDDDELRRRALDQRPEHVRLVCLTRDQLARNAVPTATEWWIDLATADDLPVPPGATKVYLSASHIAPRSTCGATALDRSDARTFSALWAAQRKSQQALQSGRNTMQAIFPEWLAELATLDFERLAQRMATLLPGHLGFVHGAVYRFESSNQSLVLAASSFPRQPNPEVALAAGDTDALAWAGLRRRRLCVADAAALCRLKHWKQPLHLAGPGPQGWLVLPLIAQQALVGVLECARPTAPGHTEAPLPPRGLQSFLGQQFGNALSYQLAQHEARIDALTGLFNYRWMMESLEREIRRVERHPAPLTLLMLDLDSLKQINDTYGHQAGDAVLKRMAEKLREALRGNDLPARIGGDEFAAILPDTDATAAGRVLKSLRARLAAHAVEFGDAEINSSISIGLASWRPGMSSRQLLHAADQSLYAVKSARDKSPVIQSQ